MPSPIRRRLAHRSGFNAHARHQDFAFSRQLQIEIARVETCTRKNNGADQDKQGAFFK